MPHCPFLGNVGAEILKNKNKNKNSKSPQNQKKVCRQKRKKINRRERKEQTEESHCRTAGACDSLRESLARSLTLLVTKEREEHEVVERHTFSSQKLFPKIKILEVKWSLECRIVRCVCVFLALSCSVHIEQTFSFIFFFSSGAASSFCEKDESL